LSKASESIKPNARTQEQSRMEVLPVVAVFENTGLRMARMDEEAGSCTALLPVLAGSIIERVELVFRTQRAAGGIVEARDLGKHQSKQRSKPVRTHWQAAAAAEETVFGAHGLHAAVPVAALNVFGGQEEQGPPGAPEYPATHKQLWAEPEPAGDTVLGGHRLQLAEAVRFANVPAGQSLPKQQCQCDTQSTPYQLTCIRYENRWTAT
jgi:hypothetical protein